MEKDGFGGEAGQYFTITHINPAFLDKKVNIALGKGWLLRGNIVCPDDSFKDIKDFHYVQVVTLVGGTAEDAAQLRDALSVVDEEFVRLVNERSGALVREDRKFNFVMAVLVIAALVFLNYMRTVL